MAPIATSTETPAATGGNGKAKYSTKEIMHMEHEYSAYVTRFLRGLELIYCSHNYHPLPVYVSDGCYSIVADL